MDDLELLKIICDFEHMKANNTDISRYDIASIKDKPVPVLNLNNMFSSFCIPHFFFGNIKTPSVIILGNNPSYSQIFEDLEYLQYRDKTLDAYINYSDTRVLDYTNKKFDIRKIYGKNLPTPRGSRGNRSTYEWWTNNVFNEENKNKFNIETTAVFNLIGYHSPEYKSIKEEALINNKDELKEALINNSLNEEVISNLLDGNYDCRFLPTSNAIARYIRGLLKIKKDDIKIYFLWKDHNDWYKLLPELEKYKIKDEPDNYIIKNKKKDKYAYIIRFI